MNHLRFFQATTASIALTALFAWPKASSAQTTVGVMMDGPQVSRVLKRSRTELARFATNDKIVFPEAKQITAGPTLESAARALTTLLEDPQVDLVWAMGVLSSQAAAGYKGLPKPVIAPFVLASTARALRAAKPDEKLSYIIRSPSLKRDLEVLLSLGPLGQV